MSVWVDPVTGSKRFATRAAAPVRIDATGYAVETDETRTALPPLPVAQVFDDEAQRSVGSHRAISAAASRPC